MSGMSNASNRSAPTARASEAAETPRVTPEVRRQAARAFCSGYYGTSRSDAIEATLNAHAISITVSVRKVMERDIRIESAHINELPIPVQVALLDELRQEVLARNGELDAPMTEHLAAIVASWTAP